MQEENIRTKHKEEIVKNKKNLFKNGNLMIAILSTIGLLLIFSFYATRTNVNEANIKDLTYNEFIKMLDDGEFDSVKLKGNDITATSKDQATIYNITRTNDLKLTDRLLESNVTFEEYGDNSTTLFSLFLTLLPMAFLFYMMQKMRSGPNLGSNKIEENEIKKVDIHFDDVAGEDEAKDSLLEIVDFLHNPDKYNEIGARLPKGALLVGPPGTGKTLLAKAVAGEAGVPFFSVSGSDFVEMFVGVGASRVRKLFKKASAAAPCIIFIDEIDAIGKSRASKVSGNDEREQTLNQLLSEMDGFDPSSGIIVLAATNRPETLDPALLRPGRFDRRIIVERPDLKGREDILKVHLNNVKIDESVNLKDIALSTSGASGADLANMVNEAAISAAKDGRSFVEQKDLQNAIELVFVGKEKKNRILNEKERKIVAYHEIGHALVTALQKHTEPVQKITIIPRTMGALGYVMQKPEEETYLKSKDELNEQIIICLAGRAAEEVCCHTVTTGASNDIEKATELVRAMITEYGMSDKFGMVGFAKKSNPYLSDATQLLCGSDTSSAIDQEVIRIVKESYETAKEIISSHTSDMDRLADFLLLHETITGKEFMEILTQSINE